MKIAIVVGTRPEIIKCSPVIKLCEKRGLDYFVVHTGQHYSYEMDRVFFEQLSLPEPRYNLNIGSTGGTQAENIGLMMAGVARKFIEEVPSVALVQGDTNTVLAAALATKKLSVPTKLGHIEACLRSYDSSMPEETNRVITDHISDFLYAPTQRSVSNAVKENISRDRIIVTGNTIVDAIQDISKSTFSNQPMKYKGFTRGNYFLATAHRQENVDSPDKLRGIIEGLAKASVSHDMPVVYPVHPRTRKLIEKFGIEVPEQITMTDPLGFFEFFTLQKNAALVLTDSGGVQEESCILGVPCVTLRENTERPETLEVGSNVLSGTDPDRIAACAAKMLSAGRNWPNPFGDGRAAERIVDHIVQNV